MTKMLNIILRCLNLIDSKNLSTYREGFHHFVRCGVEIVMWYEVCNKTLRKMEKKYWMKWGEIIA